MVGVPSGDLESEGEAVAAIIGDEPFFDAEEGYETGSETDGEAGVEGVLSEEMQEYLQDLETAIVESVSPAAFFIIVLSSSRLLASPHDSGGLGFRRVLGELFVGGFVMSMRRVWCFHFLRQTPGNAKTSTSNVKRFCSVCWMVRTSLLSGRRAIASLKQ